MKQRIIAAILCMTVAASLCACQANPQNGIVTSKNDGSFDASSVKSAENSTEKIQSIDCTDSFSSTDGSVTFTVDIHEQIQMSALPVVEVAPHTFTTEDAKNIAAALFGDAQLYETEPEKQLSKAEIRENLALWSQYLNKEKLLTLYLAENIDDADTFFAEMSRIIQAYIDKYTAMIETAPDVVEHTPCQWTFYPDTHYYYTQEELETLQFKEKSNLIISAWSEVADIPYTFSVSNRDENDYKVHNIFTYIMDEDSPNGINKTIILSELCRAGVPTEEQMENAKKKAFEMLYEMGIGDWNVDQCYYEPLGFGKQDKYTIYVNAVPVFNEIPVVRQVQLGNLKSTESYASNYYYTDASFRFTTDGCLLSCTIMSPVDVVQILNDNVQTLEFEELLEKAKTHLSLYDYYEYAKDVMYDSEQVFDCTVNITEMEYGLTRVKVPNTKDSYYYVPAITLRGNYQAYAADSGELWFDSNDWWNGEQQTLLVLNAVDGSVINVTNGY